MWFEAVIHSRIVPKYVFIPMLVSSRLVTINKQAFHVEHTELNIDSIQRGWQAASQPASQYGTNAVGRINVDSTSGIYDGTRYRFGVGSRGNFCSCNVDADGCYCSIGSFESDIFRHFLPW